MNCNTTDRISQFSDSQMRKRDQLQHYYQNSFSIVRRLENSDPVVYTFLRHCCQIHDIVLYIAISRVCEFVEQI